MKFYSQYLRYTAYFVLETVPPTPEKIAATVFFLNVSLGPR